MDKTKIKNEILAHFGVFYTVKDVFSGKKKIKELFSKGPMDITFLALVIALLTIGIIMMFSASYVNAWYDADAENDPYFYVKKQVLYAIFGLGLMLIISRINTDVFRGSSSLIFIIALILLIYVLINPAVIPGKEEFKRWISVPVFGTFQPSEIAKLAIVMFLAFSMERYHKLVEMSTKMTNIASIYNKNGTIGKTNKAITPQGICKSFAALFIKIRLK